MPRVNLGRFQSTRPLRGATRLSAGSGFVAAFQSTRPLRGATIHTGGSSNGKKISIHAPLAGRDWSRPSPTPYRAHFNPRAPCGARPISDSANSGGKNFNPRAPCGARLRIVILAGEIDENFNPRAPCGARQQTCTKNMYMFVRTDKRNSFPCRTLSVRAPDEKL